MDLLFEKKGSSYIDLKINGRLFPSWILANFKKYKLPEVILSAEDPCNTSKVALDQIVKKELRLHQQFISKYLDYNSPYRNILLYHGLGSGKTAAAINVYNVMYNSTPGWNVFLLLKASLTKNWVHEINKWLDSADFDFRKGNIIFINYDSPIADKKFMNAVKNADTSKKSMYIIEECHNFISNVYSNISSGSGKRAQVIYDYIKQDKLDNPDTRVILLSGTPSVNRPYEFALLFNLLRPGIFPMNENEFNQLFITTSGYERINTDAVNIFQRRIMGLVSYYYGSTPDFFASKTIHYIDVVMSEYHEEIYSLYEEIERNMSLKSATNQVYKSYTRQASNFVFPQISQSINGELRPRPNKFKVSMRDANKIMEGKDIKVDKKNPDSVMNIDRYKEAINQYIVGITKYLESYNQKDIQNGRTIMEDVKVYKSKYNMDFQEYHTKEKIKSSLYGAMHQCSAKMLNIIFNIECSPGPVLVYSNYVKMEGLELLKIYMFFFNYYNFMNTKKLIPGKLGYTEFHGDIKSFEERDAGMIEYNKLENKTGQHIKAMLVSKAGAEGLSLMNVRQVHIMEPYWNEIRIEQMIGRGVRYCSHKDLNKKDRHVDVYRYKSIKKDPTKQSTDQFIENSARTKNGVLQSFQNAIKEVAIDCALNKSENMLVEEYKCFQFEETSMFDKNIGPAYKPEMFDDLKMDNGSNSNKAVTLKIKVMKIKAVPLLTDPNDLSIEPSYGKVEQYWYYDKTGIVYDKDLHYPVGRVGMVDGLPKKLNKETYILDYMIPIPHIV